MYMTSIDKTEEKATPSGVTVRWLLTEEAGAPLFEMRYFEIGKGRSTSGRPHPFEHEVYVVRGKGTIEGDGQTIAIQPGDAILILPGERHKFINTTDDPLGIICLIPKGKENELK
ncbi:MAG: cupin domain-containing protein [Spirochaetes bacterium]|nr:cupin domain-containing protein [Spirochaetota bacterium]